MNNVHFFIENPTFRLTIDRDIYTLFPMRIDLGSVKKEAKHLEETFDPELTEVEGPAAFQGDIAEISGGYELTGFLDGMYRLNCSRCLEPFTQPFHLPVRLILKPRPEFVEPERDLAADELDLLFYDDHIIDIGKILRDEIVVNMPLKPVCDEKCRGLCPQCGQNLNKKECSCEREADGGAWSALKSIKKAIYGGE